jgi:ketosteroid isomerase-like protein
MAPTIIRDSQVPMEVQLALVNKYSSFRKAGDVDAVMAIVTDDITLDSSLATASGRRQFDAYLRKQQKSGEADPAFEVDGVATIKGKTKVAFIPISFIAKFGIVDTDDGPKIEKIVVSRA